MTYVTEQIRVYSRSSFTQEDYSSVSDVSIVKERPVFFPFENLPTSRHWVLGPF